MSQILIAGATLLVALMGLGHWLLHHERYAHFAVHEPERVYRSAWLESDAIAELVRVHQLKSVVNLCEPGEMGNQRRIDERRAVAQAGARLIEIPMPMTPDSLADLGTIAPHLEMLGNAENFPMLVHCQHGIQRTAKFLVAYDMLYRGKSAHDSLSAMPLFGHADVDPHVRAFADELESTTAAAQSSSPVRR